MISMAEALTGIFPPGRFTPEEQQSIEDVLDAAASWMDGKLPLPVAAEQGEIADRDGVHSTAAYGQYRAAVAAIGDRRHPALMAMLDQLTRRQRGIVYIGNAERCPYAVTHFDLAAQNLRAQDMPIRKERDPWT